MSAQSAEATVVSEDSVPTSEVTEQTSTEQTPGTFAQALAEAAVAAGHQIDTAPTPEAEEPIVEKPEAVTEIEEPVKEPEQPEPVKDEPIEPVAATEPEKKSIDEQIAEFKTKGEKPPWYLSRIAEETQKRRERTDDLRKVEGRLSEAESEVQQLRGQLSQAHAPTPTPQSPLADVYDEGGLQKLESTYEKVLEFAEKNRDGAENVLVGKNADGSDNRKDFAPEEVADMRYKADKALRKDIPQRRAYLVERSKADAEALNIYPEFKDSNSDMTKEALGLLRARPELETLLGPEVLIWVGHALKGREAFLSRNGKASATPATPVEKIERASKTAIAPTLTKSRALPERAKGADIAALAKQLEETGDAESATNYVAALLRNRGNGARKLEPAAE